MSYFILRHRGSNAPTAVETDADDKWVFDSIVEHLRISPTDVFSFSKSVDDGQKPVLPSVWDIEGFEELIFKMVDAPIISNEARCLMGSELMSQRFILSFDDNNYKMTDIARKAFDELIENGLLTEEKITDETGTVCIFEMTEKGRDYPGELPREFKEIHGNFTIFDESNPEPQYEM